MSNFNPNQANQPTIQRDSFLFIECAMKSESHDVYQIVKIKVDTDFVRDFGIGGMVATEVQRLVQSGYIIENVYVGSLL